MKNPDPAVPIEALLAQRAWVRALARALVADPQGADDLEQRTWLAALRRPPRAGSRVRAWLGAVVRNIAYKDFRAAERRRRRERSAARREAVPAVDELVAETEAHRQVVDRLLELDEPYRTTLVLRFFRQLTAREIARTTGTPLGTVRARIQRGLSRLRGRMGENRSAWCAALLPLVGSRPAATAAKTAGVAVVSKKTTVFVVLWAVVITGLYVRERVGSTPPPTRTPTTRDAVDSTGAVASDRQTPPSAREERDRFILGWLGSRTGLVRGRLEHAGTKIPLRVVCRLVFTGALPDGTKLRHEVTTRTDGTFSVPNVRYPLNYSADCTNAEEGIEETANIFVLDPDDLVRIRVEPAMTLQGRVVDQGGAGVPHAVVHFKHAAGRKRLIADSQGRVRARLEVQAVTDGEVAAAAPGHYPARGRVTRSGPSEIRLDITLPPGPRVSGVLRDPNGEPIVDEWVVLLVARIDTADVEDASYDAELHTLMQMGWSSEVSKDRVRTRSSLMRIRTDAAGRFEAWAPGPADAAWLVIRLDGRPVWYRELPALRGRSEAVVDLGTLTMPEPSQGISVVFQSAQRVPAPKTQVMFSDAEAPRYLLVNSRILSADDQGIVRTPFLVKDRPYLARVGGIEIEFVAADGVVLTLPAR